MTSESVLRFLRYPSMTALSKQPSVMRKAKAMVSIYYFVFAAVAFQAFQNGSNILQKPNFTPIWPLAWAHALGIGFADSIDIVRYVLIVASLIAVVAYRYRVGRALVFIGIWQMHALESSFGYPNHQWYPWVYTALIFVFLPDVWKEGVSDEDRRKFLFVIWWAQAMFMLLYTMSGLGKVFGIVTQLMHGEINGLSTQAFAYQIARWLPQLQEDAPLGPFMILHPAFGWPLYIFTQYIQVTALWVMVRTSLQRLWGLELLAFHIGTYLFMGISFNQWVFLLIPMMLCTPFTDDGISWRELFFDLPVIGQAAEYVRDTVIRRKWLAI